MNTHLKKYCLPFFFLLAGCVANVHYDDALFYLAEKEYSKAITELRLAMQEEPLNKEIHHKLASSYMATNRLTEARKAYQTILMIDVNDAVAKSQIDKIMATIVTKGKDHLKKEEYKQAYNTFKDVLNIDIENKEAIESIKGMIDKFIELGDKAFLEENYANASANYGIALEIDPKTSERLTDKLNKIKKIYEDKGDKIKSADSYAAVDEYNMAIAVDPENSELHFKVANIYGFFTEFNDYAFLSYTRAIDIAPLTSKYHSHLGELYLKKGDFKRAEKEYLYALKLVEKEISDKKYNKAAYKYYYDSILPLSRGVKEIEGKEGLYISFGTEKSKKEEKLDLTNDKIKLYKKAKDISDAFTNVYSLVKDSKAKDSERLDIVKDLNSIIELFAKNNEDRQKEKEFYDSMVAKFEKIGITSNDKVIKLGSLMGE